LHGEFRVSLFLYMLNMTRKLHKKNKIQSGNIIRIAKLASCGRALLKTLAELFVEKRGLVQNAMGPSGEFD
jgi:hypothetical protein